MKTNRLKTIGITVGVCATLWFLPNSVEASEDGTSLNLDINLLNEKEDKAAIVDIQIDNIPIVGDLKVKIPSKNTVNSESEEGKQKNSALATVELGGGDLVEDLDVSVLEKTTSENATSDHQKSSLASVKLTTPLTEEVDVDVLLSDATTTSDSSSFDAGVIEVNAPNLPILGDTHVGVVDKHTAKDSESSSVSTGLVQADLDGDLLKDTAVKVLARNKSTIADGTTVSTDGVSVLLGTDLVNAVKVAVLTNEQVFPSSAEIVPAPETGGDETTPTPDIPTTDIEEIEKPAVDDGLVPNTDDQTDGTGSTTDTSKSENDLTVNKDRNTIQTKPTYRYVISSSNTDLAFDFTNSTDAQNSDGFKAKMGAVLPKTGGPMDGALLTLLSLVLLASGLAVRRVAMREQ